MNFKKVLAILLILALALSLAACSKPAEPQPQTGNDEPTGNEQQQTPPEPAKPEYEGITLSFKNKTGVTITGLYLYEQGAADKGHSLCIAEWPDKDADGELYEFNTFLYRKPGAVHDLYVTFEDGSDATWAGLTLSNYDKLSLKKGTDVANWEQEPVDDEDKPALDELAKAGRTGDGFYPGYVCLGLELKNKTDVNITKMYFYETGGTAESYPDIIALNVEDGIWKPGKGGQYLFGYFVRPETKTYELKVVYEDGSELIVPDIDLFTPDGDGHLVNEISLKDAKDPDLEKIQYDDGYPEPIAYINDAIVGALPLDGWLPTVK